MFDSLKNTFKKAKEEKNLQKLSLGLKMGRVKLVEKILESKPILSLEFFKEHLHWIFFTSLVKDKSKIFEILFLSQNFTPEEVDPTHEGVWSCVMSNSTELLQKLIEAGFESNVPRKWEGTNFFSSKETFMTPLELAFLMNKWEAAEVLWDAQSQPRVSETLQSLLCRSDALSEKWLEKIGQHMDYEEKATLITHLTHLNPTHGQTFFNQLMEEDSQLFWTLLFSKEKLMLFEKWNSEWQKNKLEKNLDKQDSLGCLKKPRL